MEFNGTYGTNATYNPMSPVGLIGGRGSERILAIPRLKMEPMISIWDAFGRDELALVPVC
jgi:hypothetical protein